MSSFVTKQTNKVATTTGSKQDKRAVEAERKQLMNQLKKGEEDDEHELDVTDIANYIQNELKIGWKTAEFVK